MTYKMICQQCECIFEAPVARKYCDDCVPKSHAGRPSKYQRLVGARYGKLTTLDFKQEIITGRKMWYAFCLCECGNQKWINWINVASGKQQSCGCGQKEAARTRGSALHWGGKRVEIAEYAISNPLLTYSEIGKKFGVTRERVRQVLLKELGENAMTEQKKGRASLSREALEELERLRALLGAK